MKALLLNPHKLIPKSLSVTQRPSPPLGLAYIASALQAENFEITVFDCIAEAPNHYFPFEGSKEGEAVIANPRRTRPSPTGSSPKSNSGIRVRWKACTR